MLRCGVPASLPLARTTPGHLLLLLAMAPRKYAAIEAVISALEQELEQLPEDDPIVRRRITAARSERNALAPLTSLSPEIVRQVFELLQEPPPDGDAIPQPDEFAPDSDVDSDSDDDTEDSKDGAVHFLHDGWMAFANTCSWTRAVAVAFPALWTRIDCSSGERALRSAERAGDMPLVLYLPPCPDAPGMQFLADHVLRATDLVYDEGQAADADREVHERRFVDALNGACPRLETLTLVEYHEDAFLTGVYENLHTVVISSGEYCPYQGSMAHLPRLRNLTLDSLYIDDGVFELVRMLNSCSAIENLSLIDLGGCVRQPVSIHDLDTDVDVESTHFKITLPVLQKLVLKTDLRSSAVFMRIVPLPSESLSVTVTVGDKDWMRIGRYDSLYQRQIVERARAFWKAATGRTTFDDGTFRADMELDLYWVRWTGAHEAKSVFVSTPMGPAADVHVHDCTVLEWVHPEHEVWEPLGNGSPVMVNLRKVVLNRADDIIPRGLRNLKTWLVRQREAGRKIDVVEFVKCKPEKQVNAEKVLGGLGVEVIWR
jgi:hypothetical protein